MKSAQFERKPLEDPILQYVTRMEVVFKKTPLLQKSLSLKTLFSYIYTFTMKLQVKQGV